MPSAPQDPPHLRAGDPPSPGPTWGSPHYPQPLQRDTSFASAAQSAAPRGGALGATRMVISAEESLGETIEFPLPHFPPCLEPPPQP